MSRVIRHVMVTGRVQGVGYRAWVCDAANARGLQGWVRNRRDGSVETVFEGEIAAVDAMIAECRNGPSYARVANVVASETGEELLALRRDAAFAMLSTV